MNPVGQCVTELVIGKACDEASAADSSGIGIMRGSVWIGLAADTIHRRREFLP